MSLVLMGSTSGSVTLQEPAIAGSTVLSLPATTGTVGLTTSQIGMKNRIINGAMVIDQRNAGAAVTVNDGAVYTLDRWHAHDVTDGVYTVQQSSVAPTGFTNSLLVTTTTADTSLAAGQYTQLVQYIEGFNVADLGWGTANAQPVTLSFWVRSSLTGNFGGSFANSGNATRSYPFSFTISAANTWEYKTITVAGDTAGTWLTTNGMGMQVRFGLGAGSTFSGTANAWVGSNIVTTTGAVSVIGTLNATFYITGVQLELGSAATTFDFRAYGTELALCQRYFVNWVGDSSGVGFPSIGTGYAFNTTNANIFVPLPVSMRTTPSASFSGTITIVASPTTGSLSAIGSVYKQSASALFINAQSTGLTTNSPSFMYVANASTNSFSLSAEL